MVNKLIVNKLLIVFTCLRNDSVFGFAYVSGASRADNFCCSGRPQISSFFFDNAKVRKNQITSKFFRKKSTQKSTHTEMVDKSATVLQLLQLNLRHITLQFTLIFIYINIYINIKVFFDLQVRDF